MFHVGQRLKCRGEEWQITGAVCHRVSGGSDIWEISARGLTRIVQGKDFVFLSHLEPDLEILDPADIEPQLDTSPSARRTKLFWEAHLRRLLPRNGALYLGQHGAVEPKDYQFEPAAKALHSLRPRILIGDAVGLGKTIECGILLSELIRRGKAQRILCAVPKAILEQFQMEMWGRFAIPLHRLDSKGLERLRQELPSAMNPFYFHDKVIISIDTLKVKDYQRNLESAHFDVVVIDECHNVADRSKGQGASQRHELAKRLCERAQSVILMSATPHDGTKEGFASLVKLLDRTRISDEESFQKSDFDDLFIRRTRASLREHFGTKAALKQKIETVPLSDAETNLLWQLHQVGQRSALATKRQAGATELFQTTLIKSFLSSPQALAKTVDEKIKRMAEADKKRATRSAEFDSLLTALKDVQADVAVLGTFSRFQHLFQFLKKNPPTQDSRIVIFTERLATLRALADVLLKEKVVSTEYLPKDEKPPAGTCLTCIDGQMRDTELMRVVKEFNKAKSSLHILLATNVASEGLNLHKVCHKLIHFDLPWSLITLQQRNGRIDRLGQTRTPEIYYFASVAAKDTREAKAGQLRDDFWVVNKLEKRIAAAAEDMSEEALARFVDAEQEELNATESYEKGTLWNEMMGDANAQNPLLALLQQGGAKTKAAYKKNLPSLYHKTPQEFVKQVCAEGGLGPKSVSSAGDDALSVRLSETLRFEASTWPREVRPHEKTEELHFRSDPLVMQQFYERSLEEGIPPAESFLNEINPAIALLENTALGFFPGNKIPTVALKGSEPGLLVYLVQASLLNRENQVIAQAWQVVEFQKGAQTPFLLVNPASAEHVAQVCAWINERFKSIRAIGEISPHQRRKIKDKARQALDLVAQELPRAFASQLQERKGLWEKELQRVRKWQEKRRAHLELLVQKGKDAQKAKVYNDAVRLAQQAERELHSLDADAKGYARYLEKFLESTESPDVRILGCLVGEE
ncbi:MAG: DEAD/DEAH box helicase [Silvanigrellales bacterium]|nr:DEAD/DEAH box helicase [Silvanigrellales bacterium]